MSTSSTRVELYTTTLLGAPLQFFSFFAFCLLANKVKSHHGENRTLGQTFVVFEGNHYTAGVTGCDEPMEDTDSREAPGGCAGLQPKFRSSCPTSGGEWFSWK